MTWRLSLKGRGIGKHLTQVCAVPNRKVAQQITKIIPFNINEKPRLSNVRN